jgi:hypothetical protein
LSAILARNGGVYTVFALSAAEARVFFDNTRSLIRVSFYRQHNIVYTVFQLLRPG